MAEVTFRGLRKSFNGVDVVRGIDLDIADRAFVALVGPSGCGKSTTLRMLAGLEEISGGEVRIDGDLVNGLAPADRNIAMVFQNYALYPHMTVRGNISFGLQQRRLPRDQIARKVAEVARMLQIEPLLDRRPRALSGGQRQRVAIGRAMVREPKVFLFDEPLSNLDAKLRVQMRTEIKRLHQLKPTTTLYVTHDQVEAMTMADQIVVMNDGAIEQVGTPQDLYARPATRFVAGFIGSPAMNFLAAGIVADGSALCVLGDSVVPLSPAEQARLRRLSGNQVILGVRPEHLAPVGDGEPGLKADIEVVEPLGQHTLVYFPVADGLGCASLDPRIAPGPGVRLTLRPLPDSLHLIDPATNRLLA